MGLIKLKIRLFRPIFYCRVKNPFDIKKLLYIKCLKINLEVNNNFTKIFLLLKISVH